MRNNFDSDNRLISIVVPLFNEQDNVFNLIKAVQLAMKGYDYEIIAVDDGSTDETVQKLAHMACERLKIVVLSRNFGQTSAMAAGIAYASGVYIATMDGDLQNDPQDIPGLLVHAMQGNWDIVAGYRANRLDGLLLRKLPSRIANVIIRNLTGVHLRDYGCTLKVFRKDVAARLGLYGELHRFIPVLGNLAGARMTELPVRHHKRLHGTSKYGLGRTTKVMSDLLLMVYMQQWLKKPMHLFGALGGSLFLSGFAILVWQLFHLFSGTTGTLAGLLLLLTGMVVVLMGFIAEIQMRIYYEGSGKVPYVVREVIHNNAEPAWDTGYLESLVAPTVRS
jgi:glycosyltransferase involved in cell wall biosynthesis